MNALVQIEARLRERGLRVTQQRLAVMEYLVSTPDHPTAEDVGRHINARAPTASRASVYNVLHSLKRAGLIEELILEDAVVRYDANLEGHAHFVCRQCRLVEDLPRDVVPEIPGFSLDGGRIVETATVTLKGLCARCAPAPSAPSTGSRNRPRETKK